MDPTVVTHTSARHLSPARQGKVRDIYELENHLLIVATDRISAFDVVLPDGIPGKGKVLTRISSFWFRRLSHVVANHVVSVDMGDFPEPFRSLPEMFEGRSMLVRKAMPLPVECVVRGYVSGSGWIDYMKTGSISGLKLPAGLRESDRLPEPIFTPSTKAQTGQHDETISFNDVVDLVGKETSVRLRDLSLQLYSLASAYAETKGVIIADTKFEFGIDENGTIVWIDEALTPDSSRFWPRDQYRSGGPQPSFDKQFVRDYLVSIQWNKKPPAPSLPPHVIDTTRKKYVDALRLLTGSEAI